MNASSISEIANYQPCTSDLGKLLSLLKRQLLPSKGKSKIALELQQK